MDIDGIKVTVTGDPYPNEIEGYVRRGLREHGTRLTAMEITLDGADCDIHYILRLPFERIRRITGYLVGTTERWNSAKYAELEDRVAHSTTPSPGESPQEEAPEAQERPAIRAEDFVLHKPTGEEWVVAGTNGKDLIPCGYPFPSLAKLEDCELIKSRNIPQPEDVKRALREHGLISFIEGDPQESEAKP